MHSYSLGVAIFDFVPVLISALGLHWLARAIAYRHPPLAVVARAAALLIPFGGFCKASWKLIVATQGEHIDWLENLLFIAMAPGFIAMSYSLFHAKRSWQNGTARYSPARLLLWLALPLLVAAVAAVLRPESRLWFFCLLGATTIANTALIAHAIAACRWSGLGWPQACFVYNFAATLALSGLSRLPPGESTAWIQEAVNTSAQAALALGAWRLSRRMMENP